MSSTRPATTLAALRARFRSLGRHPDLRVIGLILAMKLVLVAFGAAVVQVDLGHQITSLGDVFTVWNRWDAPHYLYLAEHGYQAAGEHRWFLAFFPLFPWLIRSFAPWFGFLGAALVIATISSLALAVVLRRLAELDGEGLGEPTVWFLFIFPTAYFLHVGYTESLFLLLSVGAFLAARHRAWWVVGLLAFLASLTRMNGLVLVPALGLEAWQEYRRERRFDARWLWIGTALLGIGVYLVLNQVVGGDPLRFLDLQREHWYRRFAWPWSGVAHSLDSLHWRGPADSVMVSLMEPVFVVVGLVATIAAWFRLRVSYAVWMTGNWLMSCSQTFVFGVPRFTMLLFPMFILMAQATRPRPRLAALATFASLLFLAFFCTQFAQGHWAF